MRHVPRQRLSGALHPVLRRRHSRRARADSSRTCSHSLGTGRAWYLHVQDARIHTPNFGLLLQHTIFLSRPQINFGDDYYYGYFKPNVWQQHYSMPPPRAWPRREVVHKGEQDEDLRRKVTHTYSYSDSRCLPFYTLSFLHLHVPYWRLLRIITVVWSGRSSWS